MIIQCKKFIGSNPKIMLDSSPLLKKEKCYTVLALRLDPKVGVDVFIQTEDDDKPYFVALDGFEILTQTQPKTWVANIKQGDELNVVARLSHVVIRLPQPWNYPSFFKDLEEQEPKAMELFIEEAAKIYEAEVFPDWLVLDQ